jgi:hypothetical protein
MTSFPVAFTNIVGTIPGRYRADRDRRAAPAGAATSDRLPRSA